MLPARRLNNDTCIILHYCNSYNEVKYKLCIEGCFIERKKYPGENHAVEFDDNDVDAVLHIYLSD